MSQPQFDPTQNTNLQTERVKAQKAAGKELLKSHNLQNLFWYADANRGSYWHENADGEWVSDSGREFEEHLADYFELETVRPKDGKLAETKRVARHVKMYNRVDYVGRLSGHAAGFEVNNATRVLVTHTATVPKPDPDQACPTILELLDNMFGEEVGKLNQLDYFLGWWRSALEALQNPMRGEQGENGLAIVLAGDPGCGKTLLTKIIRESFGSRECQPFAFLCGLERFNHTCLSSELWLVDDEQYAIDAKSRSAFSGAVKMVTANPEYKIRGICKDEIVLHFFRRLVICTNREEERLKALPAINEDIEGKISLFLCRSLPMPMPTGTTEEKLLFWSTLMEELPGFIHWLLNVWDPASKSILGGRFGVKHFHHPHLVDSLFELSSEQILWDHIQKTLFASEDDFSNWWWEGSSTELREKLVDADSPLTTRERGYIPQRVGLGRQLSAMHRQFPEQIKQHRVNGRDVWLVVRPDRSIADCLELRSMNAAIKAEREACS
jgi:hypothetical protein